MIFDPRNNGNISKDEVILRPNVFTSLNQSKSIKNRCQVGFRFKDFWCRFCFHLPFQLASQIQQNPSKINAKMPAHVDFVFWFGMDIGPIWTCFSIYLEKKWAPEQLECSPFPKIGPSLLHVFFQEKLHPWIDLETHCFFRLCLPTDLEVGRIFFKFLYMRSRMFKTRPLHRLPGIR